MTHGPPKQADLPDDAESATMSSPRTSWRSFLQKRTKQGDRTAGAATDPDASYRPKWSMGMLNDPDTDDVPGSILLMPKEAPYNEPLGVQTPARSASVFTTSGPAPPLHNTSETHATRPPPPPRQLSPPATDDDKKRTSCGTFVLEPQPDDSPNDPLNWAVWRRDCALLSLGFYCMLGGGMTPILAAGFGSVAIEFDVTVPQVALTTGFYMLGLGLGSVVLSPTAILFGKRPVYLAAALCFVLSSVWCALATSFTSLVLARVFQGISVSSVECLPSATVAEIYFLHEKAYRLGIYTLLLLSGKNLVPLVSAAIIGAMGWRWTFWIVAIVVSFAAGLLFLFVPETFWDRTPVPSSRSLSLSETVRRFSVDLLRSASISAAVRTTRENSVAVPRNLPSPQDIEKETGRMHGGSISGDSIDGKTFTSSSGSAADADDDVVAPQQQHLASSPVSPQLEEKSAHVDHKSPRTDDPSAVERRVSFASSVPRSTTTAGGGDVHRVISANAYTQHYSTQPPKTFLQQLSPISGRLRDDNWFRVAARPFILFAYPAILWSTLIYSLSIGWLIVVSESITTIYINHDSYNFTPLQAGLVYISPFIGGVLGTVVAGKLSDVCVRYLARRNGGVYEPEFRLCMAIPIGLTTTIGLMGYGWSAEERDNWIVPTIFFGIISFGCSLGSTTSITFAVDSYRQYAGEALVTLNFAKNILHGLVFSLFFNEWLESQGSRRVFVAIGGMQLGCVLLTIPMYIWGKRARMWTVRRDFMARF